MKMLRADKFVSNDYLVTYFVKSKPGQKNGSRGNEADGGCGGACRADFARFRGEIRKKARVAACREMESALLRRYRHGNQGGWHLVLYGHADWPAAAGPALFHRFEE